MSTFSYKAISVTKQISEGQLAAKSREEAAELLAKQGLSPVTIKQVGESIQVRGTIPMIDKITFCRYLSIMLSTGLSLSEGLEVLARETKHPLMKKILTDMLYSLEQGQDMSTIFERYPGVFETYFVTLTRAGEVSGKLADVFKYLETELRSEYQLTSKVKGALLYPLIVVSAMLVIGVLMFFFVLPSIGKVFLNMKLPLPAFTKFLFTTSIAASRQFIPITIGTVVVGVLAALSFRHAAVRNMASRLIRPIPMIRSLIQKIDLARFNRIFSTLIRSAVPITDALEIALSTLSWYEFRQLVSIIPEEIRRGKSFSDVIKDKHVFPSLMVQMVAAGEKTGTLDATMADLATFYEQEVEEEVKALTQIIEPVLMLCVGVGVGAMIISIIAPIYSVVGSFQQGGMAR